MDNLSNVLYYVYCVYINLSFVVRLKSKSIAHGKPWAWSSLINLSIIISNLSIFHQPTFLVSESILSTNRGEVELGLLCHYLNPRKGKNRRLIKLSLKIYFEIMSKMFTRINDKWLSDLILRSGDIESNPGLNLIPGTGALTLTTLNTRGLKKESKIKQLLNRLHKQTNQNSSSINTHRNRQPKTFVEGQSCVHTQQRL